MKQPNLFPDPKQPRARARRYDPETSHVAAARVERRGSAEAQRALCLSAVLDHPGRTAAEIARITGLERHAPSRRLPELRDAEYIQVGPSRVCEVTGNPSMTWYPISYKESDTHEVR